MLKDKYLSRKKGKWNQKKFFCEIEKCIEHHHNKNPNNLIINPELSEILINTFNLEQKSQARSIFILNYNITQKTHMIQFLAQVRLQKFH